ncbi:hypothetical protein [Hyphomonas oceanitis]|jgi:hypothetical protein|uniref:hypothetical protein n=1 Tax=Hyphomonas oceanitis TaxID=81033 RepID=UPI003001E789
MIKKLMAATSVAALIVGGANAQLALEQTGITSTNTETSTIAAPYVLASEVDFAKLNAASNANGVGQFGLEVLTEGVIPPGQNIFLTIQISGGTIASNLNGSEFGAATFGAGAPGGITGAVVNSGGTTGATTVRYLITTDAADLSTGDATRDGISLNLPVRASGCGDVTFSVTEFQTESGGTLIEGGKASLTDGGSPAKVIPAVTCESAFNASLVLDADNSALALNTTPAFSEFLATAPDTVTTAILGDFELEAVPTAFIDLVGTAAVATQILGFEANIDVEDADEIETGEAIPGAGTLFDTGGTVAITGNQIELVGSAAAAGTDTGTFELAISGTDPVTAQSVSVSGAVLNLQTAGTSLKATDPFTEADVEDLKYEGFVFGPFDWVSDSKRAVNSIFRVTGLSPDEDVPAQIILENSRNGDSFDGVYPFTILGSSVQGSEVRINSAQLEALAGVFGTADVTMVFSVNSDLDVDRLNASPASSVVTPFGDGANQDGLGGGSTTPVSTGNDDNGNY